MANRRVGNTWIIDTVGALSSQPATGRGASKISSIGFYAIDTTAKIDIALLNGVDSSNIIFPLRSPMSPFGVGAGQPPTFEVIQIGGVFFDELNVNAVTAGTAFLYLV